MPLFSSTPKNIFGKIIIMFLIKDNKIRFILYFIYLSSGFTIYSNNMAICLVESEVQFAHFQIKLKIDSLIITQSRINYRYLTPKQTGQPPWQKRRLCI